MSNSTKRGADTTATATHLTGHSPALDRKLLRLQVMDSAALWAVTHRERDLGSAATEAPSGAIPFLPHWYWKEDGGGSKEPADAGALSLEQMGLE